MKKTRLLLTTLTLWLAATTPAFAATTTRVYSSGLLVLVFLGFCALVVVVQLIPAFTALWGLLKSQSKKEPVEAKITA
ncbi:MAG: hypothetical protein FD174_3335 [Geobacteraceae bacterium]|nr:MAG: hypothetical protein FD174_3335 [Geobacteraceae bacterium]